MKNLEDQEVKIYMYYFNVVYWFFISFMKKLNLKLYISLKYFTKGFFFQLLL